MLQLTGCVLIIAGCAGIAAVICKIGRASCRERV